MGNLKTLRTQGATTAVSSYGLAAGRGRHVVPVGLRGHVGFDNSDVTSTSITYRTFYPLSDVTVGSVLPVFGNWQSLNGVGGDHPSGAAPITIACAVETSDGAVVPFTFGGGNHTTVIQPGGIVSPDAPLGFGDQVAANDKFSVAIARTGVWIRTYVSVAANRTDTAGTTSGSSTVTDTSILATDAGRLVTGTGIPTNAYVGAVTAGVSFVLMSGSTQAAVNATVTNASASLTFKSPIPLNLGLYSSADNYTTGTGADLTLAGSGSVTGGSGSYLYGPMLLLGAPQGTPSKPIAGVWSDSIFDGYSDDFHSSFFGPVARAALTLGYPLVKLSRGGEAASQVYVAAGRKYRATFLEGITHLIVQIGTNDGLLTNGAGVTNLQTRITALGTYLTGLGIRCYLATVPPRTTSTDSWATTGNQTPVAGSQIAQIAAFNQWVRAVPSPYLGVVDLAGLVSSAQDSGLWAASATGDGVHPSDTLSRGSITTAVQTLMSGWSL